MSAVLLAAAMYLVCVCPSGRSCRRRSEWRADGEVRLFDDAPVPSMMRLSCQIQILLQI